MALEIPTTASISIRTQACIRFAVQTGTAKSPRPIAETTTPASSLRVPIDQLKYRLSKADLGAIKGYYALYVSPGKRRDRHVGLVHQTFVLAADRLGSGGGRRPVVVYLYRRLLQVEHSAIPIHAEETLPQT